MVVRSINTKGGIGNRTISRATCARHGSIEPPPPGDWPRPVAEPQPLEHAPGRSRPVMPEFHAASELLWLLLPLVRSLNVFQPENADHELDIRGPVFNHSSNHASGPEGRQSIHEVTRTTGGNRWRVRPRHTQYAASCEKSVRRSACRVGAPRAFPYRTRLSRTITLNLRRNQTEIGMRSSRMKMERKQLAAQLGEHQVLRERVPVTGSTLKSAEPRIVPVSAQRHLVRKGDAARLTEKVQRVRQSNRARRDFSGLPEDAGESRLVLPERRAVHDLLRRNGVTAKQGHQVAAPNVVMDPLATRNQARLESLTASVHARITASAFSLPANKLIAAPRS